MKFKGQEWTTGNRVAEMSIALKHPAGEDGRDVEGKVFEPLEKLWNGPDVRVNSFGPGKALWQGPETLDCVIRFRPPKKGV